MLSPRRGFLAVYWRGTDCVARVRSCPWLRATTPYGRGPASSPCSTVSLVSVPRKLVIEIEFASALTVIYGFVAAPRPLRVTIQPAHRPSWKLRLRQVFLTNLGGVDPARTDDHVTGLKTGAHFDTTRPLSGWTGQLFPSYALTKASNGVLL